LARDDHQRAGVKELNDMSTTTSGPNAMGKDAFLQLMVTQMKYQDPLQPQDNSQFLAQLAQFTALEQMTNISQTDDQLLQAVKTVQTMQQLSFEHQLIGTNVEVVDSNGNTVSGTVDAIQFQQGEPQLVIQGQLYPLSSLNKVG
jgi:flagellar basal-body rod modification protein FlgD